MYTNGQRWDVPEDEYRASDRLGSSDLKRILGFGPPKSTKATAVGTATHYAALEPEKLDSHVALIPKFSGKGSVAAREEWKNENAGKLQLTADEFELVLEMRNAFAAHPKIGRVLTHQAAVFEKPITCEDPETGLLLKSKPDITLHHVVFNLKTAADASAAEFERVGGGRLWRMGYAQAGAHERDAYSAITGEDAVCCLIVVEKRKPVRLALYELSDHPDDTDRGWMIYGQRMNRAALTIEAARRKRGDDVTPRWWDREPIRLEDPMPFVGAEVGKFEELARIYSEGVL